MENTHIGRIPTGATEEKIRETELDDHNATINPQEYMKTLGATDSANVPWCVRIMTPILLALAVILAASAFVYGFVV